MPRPLLLQPGKNNVHLTVDSVSSPAMTLLPMERDRLLRRKRSQKYLDALTRLDAGGHAANRHLLTTLLDILREELPEVTIDELPIGILAKCYLEAPHDVHCLDLEGTIVRHYKSFEPLPPHLDRARGLALHSGYEFIEIYRDCLRAVKSDGTISVVSEG